MVFRHCIKIELNIKDDNLEIYISDKLNNETSLEEEIIYEGNAQGYFWSLNDDFLTDENLKIPKEL